MSRIKVNFTNLSQITVSAVAASTVATLLGLSTDAECLVESLILQTEATNIDDIQVGDSTVALTKCVKLLPGKILELSGEDSLSDEDRVVVDLRDIFLLSATAGQKINVGTIRKTVQYNK